MSNLSIDYSGLRGLVDEGKKESKRREERRTRLHSLPVRAARAAAIVAVLAVLPFALLIRGGVFAYQEWALGTWPTLLLAATATALLLRLYAWGVSHRMGAGKGLKKLFTRAAVAVGVAYVGYALVFVASANVKSEDVRSEYSAIHPLLRVASSALILVDPASVITDAGRTAEDYWLMGLPTERGVSALRAGRRLRSRARSADDRTPRVEESSRRNGFLALGFHSLRHVGTADHLHVSLRLPA